jgi:hypothetical protein
LRGGFTGAFTRMIARCKARIASLACMLLFGSAGHF